MGHIVRVIGLVSVTCFALVQNISQLPAKYHVAKILDFAVFQRYAM